MSLFALTNATINVDGVDVAAGYEAIRGFYERGVLREESFWPRPVENSRYIVAMDAIVVDIFLHSKHRTRLVRDTFRYNDDGLVYQLHVNTLTDHRG